jgi:hypothetical protein
MRGATYSQPHTPSWRAQKGYVYSIWCIIQITKFLIFFSASCYVLSLSAKNPSHNAAVLKLFQLSFGARDQVSHPYKLKGI